MGTKYSKEFKEDTLRLAACEGVAQTSEKLGVAKRQIYDWRREQRISTVKTLKGLKPGESVEEGFNRLEKECVELREANYILKKAMGFFSGSVTGRKPREIYALIAEYRGELSVALCCAVLKVRREGYYDF